MEDSYGSSRTIKQFDTSSDCGLLSRNHRGAGLRSRSARAHGDQAPGSDSAPLGWSRMRFSTLASNWMGGIAPVCLLAGPDGAHLALSARPFKPDERSFLSAGDRHDNHRRSRIDSGDRLLRSVSKIPRRASHSRLDRRPIGYSVRLFTNEPPTFDCTSLTSQE